MPRQPLMLIGAALAVYWMLLVAATHAPIQPRGTGVGLVGLDKAVHFLAYAGLAALAYFAASIVWRPGVGLFLAVMVAIAVHAALDEWTQGFVPHRAPDVRDGLADIAGALLGGGLAAAVRGMLTRKSRPLSEPAQS